MMSLAASFKEPIEQFPALDHSIAQTVEQAGLKLRIDARARVLFGADGSDYGYSREKARQQAMLDVMGKSATDDVKVAKIEIRQLM